MGKTVQMYCVKCRKKFTADPKKTQTKMVKGRSKVNMRTAVAPCPRCNTKSYKFLGKA